MWWTIPAIAALIAAILALLTKNRKLSSVRLSIEGKPVMANTVVLPPGSSHYCDLSGVDQFGQPFVLPASPVPAFNSDNTAVATVGPDDRTPANPNNVKITAIATGTANVTGANVGFTSNAVVVSVPAPVLSGLVLTPE
jgi:hypothetical protein